MYRTNEQTVELPYTIYLPNTHTYSFHSYEQLALLCDN